MRLFATAGPWGSQMQIGTSRLSSQLTGYAVAEKYPNTTFRGIDLSPIQPTFVPENVFFAVDDIEDDWVYEEGSINYIHVRHTLFSIADREMLLQRAFK